MMTQPAVIPNNVRFVMRMQWAFRHWIALLLALFALFNALPVIAPITMKVGLAPIGSVIYDLYGIISHQYANRSFFLFGEHLMYSLDELPLTLTDDDRVDGPALKALRGSPELGWKLAWSDRLLAMFGSMLVVFAVFARRRWQRFPLWLGIALVLPLILDGATHYASDIGSVISGWRYDNAWLATLTNNAFPPSLYAGDALGSFNSWMRLLTGILFGIGFFGWGLPVVNRYFKRNTDILTQKLDDWRKRQASAPDTINA